MNGCMTSGPLHLTPIKRPPQRLNKQINRPPACPTTTFPSTTARVNQTVREGPLSLAGLNLLELTGLNKDQGVSPINHKP